MTFDRVGASKTSWEALTPQASRGGADGATQPRVNLFYRQLTEWGAD